MADAALTWDDEDPYDLTVSLNALGPAALERVTEAIETWVSIVQSSARALVPVETGKLKQSIDTAVERDGPVITGAIGTDVFYSVFIEFGRGPVHADEGYLRFEIDGEVFYRKSVGPAEAQPFLRPAVAEHKTDLRRLVDQAVVQASEDVT